MEIAPLGSMNLYSATSGVCLLLERFSLFFILFCIQLVEKSQLEITEDQIDHLYQRAAWDVWPEMPNPTI